MNSFAFELFDEHLVMLAHTTQDPGPGEWAEYLVWLRRCCADRGDLAFLVVTEGGAPDAMQRGDLNEVFGLFYVGRFDTSVVCVSRVRRALVHAVGWFARRLRAYPPERLEEALSHVRIPAHRRAEAVERLNRLREGLGLPGLTAAPAPAA